MQGDRGNVRLDVGVESGPEPVETGSPGSSFDLLVLGDFSARGTGNAGGRDTPLEARSPRAVDRDELERVMGELSPGLRLELSADGGRRTIRVGFERLEHFHPDQLVRRLGSFAGLVDAYHELRRGGGSSPGSSSGSPGRDRPDGEPPERPSASEPDAGGLLDQVVSRTEGSGADRGETGPGRAEAVPNGSKDAFSEYVRDLVRPHIVEEEGPDPERGELSDRIEGVLEDAMRSLLHHPDFQALESAWRGLSFLVHRVESSSDVRIRILDLSREELARDLQRATGEGEESVLIRRLVDDRIGTPGAEPWSLLVGLYEFAADDAALLRRLGRLARSAGAPFLAGAGPSLAGLSSFRRRPDRSDWSEPVGAPWSELRRSPAAPWLGLALPRVLLRLPYGPEDAPCDAFPFREMASPPRHDDYLWGNAALPCAVLLARSYARQGWDMRPGAHRTLDRLPLHLYESDGETEAQPCAEMLMTDAVASRFMERGFIPVASVKERGSVRVVRFQSVAEPPTSLAGRWA